MTRKKKADAGNSQQGRRQHTTRGTVIQPQPKQPQKRSVMVVEHGRRRMIKMDPS